MGEDARPVTVVGIASRMSMRGLDREQSSVFVPFERSHHEAPFAVIVRTAGAPDTVLRAVADVASEVDENVPLLSLKTMEQRMAVQAWPFRTVSLIFTICGLLAVTLAVIGLASVMIYAVSRRVREFGVRVAIGATSRDLVEDVLRQGATLLVPGLIAGLLIAVGAARLARAALVGVDVLNPSTYVLVACAECAIVLVACIGPALRAARVDPLAALRAE
jgi:ABC-type antimicrobial peptide transport system permease subunit